MGCDELQRLLTEAIGLDAATIGASAVARAVRARQTACGIEDGHAYAAHARSNPAELQALVELVVVPESWFFRDPPAIEALVTVAQARAAHDHFSVLSIPCSRGEEPYSLAIALLDGGVPAGRFHIDALDVSERALAVARAGVYGKGAFRGRLVGDLRRHFTETPGGFRVSADVQRQVRFSRGNVLDAATLPAGRFDAIVCCNLLIYFDAAARQRAVTTLARLLTPEGLLFVGPAETSVVLREGFTPARLRDAHAFRRPGASSVHESTVVRPSLSVVVPRKPTTIAAPIEGAVSTEPPTGTSDIGQVLADQGRFDEAAAWCERELREQGPSAGVFHLLGLVRDALGQFEQSERCYRKALYLDPHHHEALLHLALLLEREHHTAEAQLLRRRAERSAHSREAS